MKSQITNEAGKIHAYECDVTSIDSIKSTFSKIEQKYGFIHILINNAGTGANTSILGPESNVDAIKNVLNLNLVGLIDCTKLGYELIQKSNDYGHIVNISSVVAHKIPVQPEGLTTLNVYPATKHAVLALSEVLRQELSFLNQKVRISQISPGLVETEILDAYDPKVKEYYYKHHTYLSGKDVADALLYIIGTPPHVQIHDLIIKPVGEKF